MTWRSLWENQIFFLPQGSLCSLSAYLQLALEAEIPNPAKKIYSYVFTSDPTTLDYIQSAKVSTHELTTNGVDGLLENDKYGNLAPSIAEDWTVSPDGLVYTYKLRKDAKWYTADGEEYADVTAQDFVAGIKHAADVKSDALPLIQDSIKGLSEYAAGTNKDFSAVGVKALDNHTVQ